MLVDVAYVGNHAVKLILLADLNQARPVTAEELRLSLLPTSDPNRRPLPALDSRRPIQGFRSISAVLPAAFSNYHALQVKFERRFSKGLYVLNSFTWSKAIDNVSQVLEEPGGNTGTPQNLFNLAADRGLSPYDQPFNNTTSFVWELPFGRGRAFWSGMSYVLDAFVGGWTVTGINTMTSGQAVNFRYTPSPVTANLPSFIGGVALRPNLVGNPILPKDERTIDRYFDAAAIQLPSLDQPFGNAGRNIARGDSFYQFDFGLQKNFAMPFINEASKLEFRTEFFNLFNKTNFGAPNSTFASAGFGQVRSTTPARQIQFALKLSF
jgi:hypothetical protein